MNILKKISSAFAIAALISFSGQSVNAQTLYSEDANGLTVGTTLIDADASWDDGSIYAVVAGGAVFTDNHFDLTHAEANFNFANWVDGNTYGVATMSLDLADTGGGTINPLDAGVRLAARRENASKWFDVTSQSLPDNTAFHYDVVINTTAAAVTYDDGVTTIAANTLEVWQNGSLVSSSEAINSSGACIGFGIWARRPDNAMLIDNIVIRDDAFNSPSLFDPNAPLFVSDANGLTPGTSTLRTAGTGWTGPANDYGVVAGGSVFTDNHFEFTAPDAEFNFANWVTGPSDVLTLSIDLADTGGGTVEAEAGVRLAARREMMSAFYDVVSQNLTDNTVFHFDVVINTSAAPVTYTDGVSTIAANTLEVWQDGAIVQTITPANGTGGSIGFGIWSRFPDNAILADNIEIRGVAYNGESTSVLKGDVNLDGSVTFLDINPFIGVLSSNGTQAEADCDCNGVVNFLDISPFINILANQ